MHISRFICFLVISALFLDSPSKAAEYNRLAPIHPSEKSAVVLASEWAHKCDLADRDFLENIIDPAFKNDLKLIDFAAKLLEGFKCQRSVGDGKYGQEFIPHHEVLMQLMKISKGKVVCELAAGSGINSIFLALGGAETVYVNDIVQSEMDALINRICSLSEQFKSRIKVIPGDAFSVLKDIYGTCDIVYARNFIHLFPKSEVLKFFNLLKDIVRPTGGTIVLSAHGSRERITGVWDSNVKKVSGYSYCRKNQGRLDKEIKYTESEYINSDVDPLSVEIYEFQLVNEVKSRNKTKQRLVCLRNNKLQVRNIDLPADVKTFIEKYEKNISEDLKKYTEEKKQPVFKVYKHSSRFYTPETLYEACLENEAKPLAAFLSNPVTGHVQRENKPISNYGVTVFAKVNLSNLENGAEPFAAFLSNPVMGRVQRETDPIGGYGGTVFTKVNKCCAPCLRCILL